MLAFNKISKALAKCPDLNMFIRPSFLFSLLWASDDNELLSYEKYAIALVFLGLSGYF